MSDKVHKGQLQVVEGSAVGEFHVVPKFSYNATLQVEYLAEAKVGLADHVNGHYIQKFIYDATLNLKRILTASNRATAGCSEVSVTPINQTQIKITAHNGDFNEAERSIVGGGSRNKNEQKLTTISLKTGTQEIVGQIIKVSDDGLEVTVERSGETPIIVAENNVSISETDLLLTFNGLHKPYEKRRWTNRKRYFYDTQES